MGKIALCLLHELYSLVKVHFLALLMILFRHSSFLEMSLCSQVYKPLILWRLDLEPLLERLFFFF